MVSTLRVSLCVSPSFHPISFEASGCKNLQGFCFLQMALELEVKNKRWESDDCRSSFRIYWCCSLDSLAEVSLRLLKQSREGCIKLIMPRGNKEFPVKHLLSLSQIPHILKFVRILNPSLFSFLLSLLGCILSQRGI